MKKKANRARESADEWDEIASYHPKKASKYKQNAEEDRATAKKYDNKAATERKALKAKGAVKSSNKNMRKSLSVGKKIGLFALGGPLGVRTYSSLRTAGTGKGASVALTVLSAVGSLPVQGLVIGAVNNSSVNKKLGK